MRRRVGSRMLAMAVAGLLLAGCSGSSQQTTEDEAAGPVEFTNGLVGVAADAGEPTDGGTLEFATYSEARVLDPAQTIATGSSGGTEMAAVYDVLLRYDPESGEYEPWLAKSMQPDADHTVWTMMLREGVTFSNGEPLDAAAVVASIERYLAADGPQSSLWQANVVSTEATDDLTVTFTLQHSWSGFEYLLATGPGMVVAEAADQGKKFTPIGAGPFVLDHYAPQEELVLTAREDYWDGTPHLDALRFFPITSEEGRLDVLQTGGADAAFLREPKTAKTALEAGIGGHMAVTNMSRALLLNHHEGAATADPRVRRALMHAIDLDVINQRTADGMGIMSKAIATDLSRWALETEPLAYDPEAARRLLAEAKADGYDGRISFKGVTKVSQPVGLTLKALLESVGFKVSLDYVQNVSDLVSAIFVEGDYEMVIWGFGAPDGAMYSELYDFHSESTGNVGGVSDPQLDALVEDLRVAESPEQTQATLEKIQAQWNESVPAAPLGATPEFNAWTDQVHGVVPDIDSIMLFGDAWMATGSDG